MAKRTFGKEDGKSKKRGRPKRGDDARSVAKAEDAEAGDS
jgi:hypothetical protein